MNLARAFQWPEPAPSNMRLENPAALRFHPCRAAAVALRCLGDQQEAAAPVVADAREQPHAFAVALNDQAIAVVLDFVDPFRAVGNLGATGRNAGVGGLVCQIDSARSFDLRLCLTKR
jgi:hypothetical protein